MNRLQNERGAALVFTLMLVTLLMLLVMTQFSLTAGTATQVSKTETNIDAKLIADMGIEYYYHLVKEEYERQQPIDSFQDFVNQLPAAIPETRVGQHRTFRIEQVRTEPVMITDETEQITIYYRSTGNAYDSSETENGKITITLE